MHDAPNFTVIKTANVSRALVTDSAARRSFQLPSASVEEDEAREAMDGLETVRLGDVLGLIMERTAPLGGGPVTYFLVPYEDQSPI